MYTHASAMKWLPSKPGLPWTSDQNEQAGETPCAARNALWVKHFGACSTLLVTKQKWKRYNLCNPGLYRLSFQHPRQSPSPCRGHGHQDEAGHGCRLAANVAQQTCRSLHAATLSAQSATGPGRNGYRPASADQSLIIESRTSTSL